MDYVRTSLQRTIDIDQIITMYYFEFSRDYVFHGEKHDFWEFLYVDKGEVEVMADQSVHRLGQGTVIFHKPNEFHSFYAYHGSAPNLIVVTFDCRSEAMRGFENLVISLRDEERNLLSMVVTEGANAFAFPFDYPLKRRDDAPVGSEQLVQCYLQAFLIQLLRRKESRPSSPALSFTVRERNDNELMLAVVALMKERLGGRVTTDEIKDTLHVSITRLKELFKRKTGGGMMEYFAHLKIESAKVAIREDSRNFTEIARELGFSSVHYFSKAFKKATGMSPSQYAKSVKARSGLDADAPKRAELR